MFHIIYYTSVSPQVSEEQQLKVDEAESRWRDSVERCEKLKQAYGNLRQEHINLIRAHAETKKSLESQEQLLTDITQQLEGKNTGSAEQLRNLEVREMRSCWVLINLFSSDSGKFLE